MARNNIRPFPRRKRQKGDARERANRLVLGRTFVLLILCGIVLFIPLVATLYQLMIVDHDQYEEMAIRNQTRSTTLTASRGVIYDRNMNILASSATVETIFIDPNYLESCIEAENEKREAGKEYNPAVSIDFIATGLSDLLEVDADFVREQAAQTQYYYRAIKRKVPEETAEKVREFINDNELTGIINLELDSRRYYPYGSMAAQVLGTSQKNIILRHLIPNTVGVIVINAMFTIPSAIFTEAFLSFIGIGLSEPKASLGVLINNGYAVLQNSPYLLICPAIVIILIMVCFSILGDGLRDALDPRMSK